MRLPRVKAEEGPAFYHCVSRVVEGRLISKTYIAIRLIPRTTRGRFDLTGALSLAPAQ